MQEKTSEPRPPITDDELLTAEIAGASMFRRSGDWMREHAHELPHIRLGRSIFFRRCDLRKYLDSKVQNTME